MGDKDKSTKEAVVEALEETSQGKPSYPTLPLVGSENVPMSPEEGDRYER